MISRAARQAVPDELQRLPAEVSPLPSPVTPSFGMAKITQIVGGGSYKITECTDAAGVATPLVAPNGFVDRVAWDMDLNLTWAVDDLVFWWQSPDGAGKFLTLFTRGDDTVTLDTSGAGFCGLRNLRLSADGRVVAVQVVADNRWVDARGNDL